jgi:hypothetical protein
MGHLDLITWIIPSISLKSIESVNFSVNGSTFEKYFNSNILLSSEKYGSLFVKLLSSIVIEYIICVGAPLNVCSGIYNN